MMDSGEENFYNTSGAVAEKEDEGYSKPEAEVEEDDINLFDVEASEDNYAAASDFRRQNKSYIILNEKDIKQRLEEDVSMICNILFIPRGVACALLCRYNWRVNLVQEKWFENEDNVQKALGLFPTRKKTSKEYICGICFEKPCGTNRMRSAACEAHLFCDDCWRRFINTSINDGPGCLTLCCPEPSCGSIVCVDMVESLASKEDKERYYRYLCRSYVENSKERKWCPAPGCDFAIQYDITGSGCWSESESYDVTCDCTYKFCWNCMEEWHRPVDCETVQKWMEKNSSEAENTTWILTNTKPCPKCKRPIEKNRGCNHMRCRSPCGFSFCWACLQPLGPDHVACNRFPQEKVSEKEMAKQYSVRYTHYYERWAANDRSRKMALADLDKAKAQGIRCLGTMHGWLESQHKAVTDAWEQIAECRRVLKWTYAYGYYIPEKAVSKLRFFEYLQGEAEAQLEKLHHCAEEEMKLYENGSKRLEDFKEFEQKLKNLTSVTRNYFENLIRGLEDGLSEVEGSTSASVSKRARH